MLNAISTFIGKHFAIVMVLGCVTGIIFQNLAAAVNPFLLYLLMVVIYLCCLNIKGDVLRKEIKNAPALLGLTFFSMILLPLIIFVLAKLIVSVLNLEEDWLTGIILLFACPTAAVVPAAALVYKAHFERCLANLTVTSLIAPLTIPLLLFLLVGSSIDINYLHMVVFLLKLILIPGVLSVVTRKCFPKATAAVAKHTSCLSTLFLFWVVVGALAGAMAIIEKSPMYLVEVLTLIYLLQIAAFFIGWAWPFFKTVSRDDRMTSAMIATWMNIGLSIVLANQFFADSAPMVVFFVTLSEISWNSLFVPAAWWSSRTLRSSS